MRSIRIVVGAVVFVGAVGFAPACFDTLGPDPQFPSDGGADVSSGSDGSGGDALPDGGGDTSISGPAAVLSTTTVDFGTINCGSAGTSAMSLTITNPGTAPLTFSTTLDNSDSFSVSPSSGGTVPPGGETTLSVSALLVSATATAGAAIRGALTIDSNDPAHPTQAVSLSVTPLGGTITITPPSIDFGEVPFGQSTSVPVMITNSGNAQVAVTFTTPSDGEFGLWASATLSTSLSPNMTVSNASVTFTPADNPGVPVASSAPLTVLGATCGIVPLGIDFTGTPGTGVTEISPGALDFSTPCMGTSTAQNVTIKNVGGNAITISNVAATGGFNAGAATPSTIGPNQSATISVTPPGWTAGEPAGQVSSGDLTFDTTDAANPTVDIPLSETIFGASLAFTDNNDDTISTITFPGVPVGMAQTYAFQISNTGNAAVSITPGSLPTPPWSWGIPGMQSVPISGYAPLSLTFAPAAPGTQMAMVTVTTSGPVCTMPSMFTATGTATGGGGQDSGAPPVDGGGLPDADMGGFDAMTSSD